MSAHRNIVMGFALALLSIQGAASIALAHHDPGDACGDVDIGCEQQNCDHWGTESRPKHSCLVTYCAVGALGGAFCLGPTN